MKRSLYLFLTLILISVSQFTYASENSSEQSVISTAPDGILYDDCLDFSKVHSYSEGLYADVTTDENKYAFDDYTMFMRNDSTAQWLEYSIPENQYMIFHTYFRQNEEISHFSFSVSPDGNNWTDVQPNIEVKSVDNWKWIPVIYTIKNFDSSAKYVRITYGNIDKTPWSPSIAGVYTRYIYENDPGFADCVNTKYYESTTLLKNINLVSGYTKFEFKPENNITRAEFSKLIATTLNMHSTSFAKQIFADLPSGHWANSDVATLYGLGIIKGDENGFFYPENTITYQEALKILVATLGYTISAEESGGYPVGYNIIANRLNITNNIDLKYEDTINRGTASILLFNILDTEVISQTTFGNKNNRYQKGQNTILSLYHNIFKIQGLLTDVNGMSVISDSFHKNKVVISDEEYSIGDYPMDNLLGHKIDAYIKFDKENVVLFAKPQLDSDEIILSPSNFYAIENNAILYTDEYGNDKKINFTDNTRVLYNGRYLTRMALLDNFEFTSGFIKIISHPYNNSADVILIDDYKTYHISADSKIGYSITDKLSGTVDLHLDKAENIKVERYGENIDFSPELRVYKDDILQIATSNDGTISKVFITNNKLSGKLNFISLEDKTCKIDLNEYRLSKCFNFNLLKNYLGKHSVAYTDINGLIYTIEGLDHSTQYGYLVRTANNNPFNSSGKLKIITQSGTADVYNINEYTKMNGEKTTVSSILNLDNKLIRFTAKSDNTIINIEIADTLSASVGNDAFSLNYISDSSKYYGENMRLFESIYQLNSDTKIFVLPENKEKIEDYKVQNYSYLITNKNYKVSLYDVKDDYSIGAAVIDLAGSEARTLENSDPIGIITDIENIHDKDGNLCLAVSVIVNGENKYIYFDSLGGKDVTDNWIDNYKARDTSNGNNPFHIGEVLQYYMDSESHCKYFKMLLTNDIIKSNQYYERHLYDYGTLTQQSYFSELYSSYGIVTDKFSDKILITAAENNYKRTISTNNCKIYRYSKSKKKLYPADTTDIQENNEVFVRLNFTSVKEIIIIEE